MQTGEQLVACGEVEDNTHGDDKDSDNDRAHRKEVNSVAFSPNGRYVASGSDDMTVCIWDAENGNLIFGPFKTHTSRVYCVQFSPDSSHIASCSDDRTIRFWSLASCATSAQNRVLTPSGAPGPTHGQLTKKDGWCYMAIEWSGSHPTCVPASCVLPKIL
ncbi:WD40 domain-containing protein [Rhizoctonia solani AG-1 IA]|uniref:WD40 domain-containing protein n=1 Tax=Thanatephorus cucumeris (strain AG1-IA) TaxID=983506 RepID=L8WD52_THACA|nr:WD40 domain-containing protein [Rhizoctonia solani AG-1 IA]